MCFLLGFLIIFFIHGVVIHCSIFLTSITVSICCLKLFINLLIHCLQHNPILCCYPFISVVKLLFFESWSWKFWISLNNIWRPECCEFALLFTSHHSLLLFNLIFHKCPWVRSHLLFSFLLLPIILCLLLGFLSFKLNLFLTVSFKFLLFQLKLVLLLFVKLGLFK